MNRPTPLMSTQPGPSAHPSARPTTEPNNRRFYIPTSSAYVSPTFPPSGSRSRSSLTIEDALYRYPSAGSGTSSHLHTGASPRLRARGQGRGRGQSLVALTTALQAYRVPPPADEVPALGSAASIRVPEVSTDNLSAEPGPSTPPRPARDLDPPFTPMGRGSPGSGWSRAQLEHGQQVEMEIMDALVDIHRVMYCGREDQVGGGGREEGEGGELERVVGRWFEGDAVYDHPLLRLGSRSSLLNHFILLHLLGSGSLPAPTPGSAIAVARTSFHNLAGRTLRALSLRSGSVGGADEEAGSAEWRRDEKGKGRAGSLSQGDVRQKGAVVVRGEEGARAEVEKWKLWHVGAECTEIGGMECYDGYHLGLIEHVITLNLFPSLKPPHPRPSSDPLSTHSSSSTLSLLDPDADDAALALIPNPNTVAPPRSFSARLAGAVGREFGYLLTWELPISTVVQFNEVGRVTHIRDTIDIQDLIETFVPFAKRLNWLTRRLTGLASSVLGGVVAGLVVPRNVGKREGKEGMIPISAAGYHDSKHRQAFHDTIPNLPSSTISRDETSTTSDPDSDINFPVHLSNTGLRGLGLGGVRAVATGDNTLGLEGMMERTSGGMAPDRDEPGY